MHAAPMIQRTVLPQWLRRLGFAGFMFFLAKGLLWLALPWMVGLLLG